MAARTKFATYLAAEYERNDWDPDLVGPRAITEAYGDHGPEGAVRAARRSSTPLPRSGNRQRATRAELVAAVEAALRKIGDAT